MENHGLKILQYQDVGKECEPKDDKFTSGMLPRTHVYNYFNAVFRHGNCFHSFILKILEVEEASEGGVINLNVNKFTVCEKSTGSKRHFLLVA